MITISVDGSNAGYTINSNVSKCNKCNYRTISTIGTKRKDSIREAETEHQVGVEF